MNKIYQLTVFLICIILLNNVSAQSNPYNHRNNSAFFPDIPGYQTVTCDFHQHTVFSDGDVWPSIRVKEAAKDSIDAISLTDHLEYQKYEDDIPHPDRNRSYEIAHKEGKKSGVMVIRGAEITRNLPPGHSNAIFLTDVNKLLQDDAMEVFKEAKRQGAFIFWNHPNWISQKSNGMAELTDMHLQLIEEGLLNGIEIVNDNTFSEEAFQIALDHNLTIMGTSDIHGLIDWAFNVPYGGQRPLTLVFSKEKSEDAIKEGLFNRRTVVVFDKILAGRSEFLEPLIENSLVIRNIKSWNGKPDETPIYKVQIENVSSVDYLLSNKSEYTFHRHSGTIIVEAGSTIILDVKTVLQVTEFDLQFEVLNTFTSPQTHANLKLHIKTE
jgi:hypothetical protein